MTTQIRSKNSKTFLIVIAYLGFISLGLPDGLLGVAWPSIRETFTVPLDALGILLGASVLGYMVASFNSGRVVRWIGVGRLLAGSCALTGTALLGYTVVPAWALVVFLGFFAGMGAGAIDAGINTYVAANHRPSLMFWLHASFGVGTTLGPLIMTTVLGLNLPWQWGYIVVGVAQLLLAATFFFTAELWETDTPTDGEKPKTVHAPMFATLRLPIVWVSILLFLVYTGSEMTAGQWTFSILTLSRGFAEESAGLWVSVYWGAFTFGRVLAGFLTQRLTNEQLLRLSIYGAAVGAVLFAWNPSSAVSLIGIALTGCSLAPIFPALIAVTAERTGKVHSANAIGFQVAAASLGGALIPGLAGVIARIYTPESISLVLIGVIAVILVLNTLTTLLARRPAPAPQ